MSVDLVDADLPSGTSRHGHTPSTVSVASEGSSASGGHSAPVYADVEAEEDADEGGRPMGKVNIVWRQDFQSSILLYASHNRFREPLELEPLEDGSYSAVVSAPVGQELLYRFSVDGEFQTSPDAPMMHLDGSEYNCVMVEAEEEETDCVGEPPSPTRAGAVAPDDGDLPETPPRNHRRKSSMHWDTQRSRLVVAESTSGKNQQTPERGSPTKPAGAKTPASPRFVHLSSMNAPYGTPPPLDQEGEDSDGSDDEGSVQSSQPEGSARTKRRNRAHRAKMKQRALVFQSPLSQSAPSYNNTPMKATGSAGPSPGVFIAGPSTSNPAALQSALNALKLELMQRENEWKQAWLAHELQTFASREEERKQTKAQMNDERARWLAKLKEINGELSTIRAENLQLKSNLASHSTAERLKQSTKVRAEKFATLQRSQLAAEMTQWIKEKGTLEAQIDALRTEAANSAKTLEGVQGEAKARHAEATALQLQLSHRERELESLRAELSKARHESKASAEVQDDLSAVREQLSEEQQRVTSLRDQIASVEANLAAKDNDVQQLEKEVEALRAQHAAAAETARQTEQSLKSEVSAMQSKFMAAQEESFMRAGEAEACLAEKEAAEGALALEKSQAAAREADLKAQLVEAREAGSEQADKIRAINSVMQDLRSAHSELAAQQRNQAASFQRHFGETQSFLLESLQVQSNLLQSTLRKYRKEMSERRKLHNLVQELRGNIRVYCRVRPMTADDTKNPEISEAITLQLPSELGEPTSELLIDTGKGKTVPYQFDSVFGPDSTQSEVFEQIRALVTSVLDGYNVVLFAYGQTGAGKTHTMAGTPSDPGMNLRSLSELFRIREERQEDFDYKIKVSFYEIYNETLKDLLDARPKDLKIRQGSTGVFVEGLEERVVASPEDIMRYMEEGNKNRSVGSTEMNAQSSRSHSILSVRVHGTSHVTGMVYLGTLHLVDLAGSERLSRSQATGERQKEASAINSSLSSLGLCIEALQKKSAHIPYRNSKLTYVLQNSLGGHSKVLMIAALSPSSQDADESNCTLQFAARARSVELGNASKNVSAAPGAGGAATGEKKDKEDAGAATTPSKRPPASSLLSASKARVATAGAKRTVGVTPASARKVAPK